MFVAVYINFKTNAIMIWVIVIAIVVALMAFAAFTTERDKEKSKEYMAKNSMSFSDFYPIGKYVGGHPQVDNLQENLYSSFKDGVFKFHKILIYEVSTPELVDGLDIAASDITDITVEDSSTIENKVTLGRIILVGIFALAWRKKKKNELAFVVIEWSKGKFSHSTTFAFEGRDALAKANTARNKLISFCE